MSDTKEEEVMVAGKYLSGGVKPYWRTSVFRAELREYVTKDRRFEDTGGISQLEDFLVQIAIVFNVMKQGEGKRPAAKDNPAKSSKKGKASKDGEQMDAPAIAETCTGTVDLASYVNEALSEFKMRESGAKAVGDAHQDMERALHFEKKVAKYIRARAFFDSWGVQNSIENKTMDADGLKLVDETVGAVQNLKEGERMVFIAGWPGEGDVDKTSGLAFPNMDVFNPVMLILKKLKRTFQLLIVNRGEGVEYHPFKTDEGKNMHCSVVSLEAPLERVEEPAVWWCLIMMRSASLENARGASGFYEVLLPQMLGADFSSTIDDPTSHFRWECLTGVEDDLIGTIAACYDSLLTDGMSGGAQQAATQEAAGRMQQLTYLKNLSSLCAIHADLQTVRQQQSTVAPGDTDGVDFQVSDRKIVEQFCRHVLIAASLGSDAAISPKVLRNLRKAADIASEAAQGTTSQYADAQAIPKLKSVGDDPSSFVAQLDSLTGFDLFHDAPNHMEDAMRRSLANLAESADVASGDSFVNLSIRKLKTRGGHREAASQVVSNFHEVRSILAQINEVCSRLHRAAELLPPPEEGNNFDDSLLPMRRLVALVEHAATHILPVPKPRPSPKQPHQDCLWQTADVSKADQNRVLKQLLEISLSYVAACSYLEEFLPTAEKRDEKREQSERKSTQMQSERVSRSTVTLAVFLSIFDAFARTCTEEAGSEVDAMARALCGEGAAGVATDGLWISTSATDGTTLDSIFGWQLLSDPAFLIARTLAYDYLCPSWAAKMPKLFECALLNQDRKIKIIYPPPEEDLGIVRATVECTESESKEIDAPLAFAVGDIISVLAKISDTEWVGMTTKVSEDGEKTIEKEGSFDPNMVEVIQWKTQADCGTPDAYVDYLKATLEKGMVVNCTVANGEVAVGDIGNFIKHENDRDDGQQCSVGWWKKGRKPQTGDKGVQRWIKWTDLQIDDAGNLKTEVILPPLADSEEVEVTLKLEHGALQWWVNDKCIDSKVTQLLWSMETDEVNAEGADQQTAQTDADDGQETVCIPGKKKFTLRLAETKGETKAKAARKDLIDEVVKLVKSAKVDVAFDPPELSRKVPTTLEFDATPSTSVKDVKIYVAEKIDYLKVGAQRVVKAWKDKKGRSASAHVYAPSEDFDDESTMKDIGIQDGDSLEIIRHTWEELHAIKKANVEAEKADKAKRAHQEKEMRQRFGKNAAQFDFGGEIDKIAENRRKDATTPVPQGTIGWQPDLIGWEPDASLTFVEVLLVLNPPPNEAQAEESEEEEPEEDDPAEKDDEVSEEQMALEVANFMEHYDDLDGGYDDLDEDYETDIPVAPDNDYLAGMKARAQQKIAAMNARSRWFISGPAYEPVDRGNPRVKWIQADWKHMPEVAMLRDMVMLFKLGAGRVYPGSRNVKQCLPRFKYIDPRYNAVQRGTGGALIVCLAKADGLDEQRQPEPTDLSCGGARRLWTILDRRPEQPWQEAVNSSEDDVLFQQNLGPIFKDLPSIEEQEQLCLCLTSPQLAVPLMLQFFASRISALMNPDLLSLLEATLFESRDFRTTALFSTEDKIERVPADARSIGTEFGVLMNEVLSMPSAVFGPFLDICAAATKLCSDRHYTSAFVPLFLEIARIGCKLTKFAAQVVSVPEFFIRRLERGNTAKSLHGAVEPWCGRLEAFLMKVAQPSIREWLSGAEDDGDIVSTVCFHSYLLGICESVVSPASNVDDLSGYLSSASYVMTWKSSEQRSDGTAGPDPPPSMMSDLVLSMQLTRNTVGEWCTWHSDIRTGQLKTTMETLLERIAAVSFQADTLDSAEGKTVVHRSGWKAVMSEPIICETTRESDHPYSPQEDLYDTIGFPDVERISIKFEDGTSISKGSLVFYKDDRLEEYWGRYPEDSDSGDMSRLPGLHGNPPMVIPASSFVIHFESPLFDPTDGGNYHGFKFTASASVSQKFTSQIKQEYDAEMNSDISKLACELALQETGNRVQEAGMYLRAMTDVLERRASEVQRKQAALADSCIYTDRDEALKCSLQTGDITLHGGTMVKVPLPFVQNGSFQSVVQNITTQGLYCTTKGKSEEMESIDVTIAGQHYHMVLWQSLKPPSREQIYASTDVTRLDDLVKGTSTEKLEESGDEDQQNPTLKAKTTTRWTNARGSFIYTEIGPWQLGGLDAHAFFPQQTFPTADRPGLLTHTGATYGFLPLEALDDDLPGWARVFMPSLRVHAEHVYIGQVILCWMRESTSEDAQTVSPELLYYVWSQTGGAFYEVFAETHPCGYPGQRLLSVFRLDQHTRTSQRIQVFTSDYRFCLVDSAVLQKLLQTDGHNLPWTLSKRFSAGWLFDGCYTLKGVQEDSCTEPSLSVSRDRSAKRCEAEMAQAETLPALEHWFKVEPEHTGQHETFVNSQHLRGLVPAVLLGGFELWQGDDGATRGYAISTDGQKESEQWQKGQTLVMCQEKSTDASDGDDITDATGQVSEEATVGQHRPRSRCQVYRLPDPTDPDAAATVKPAVLLNPLSAPAKSMLARVAGVLTKIEQLSHMLFWSDSWGQPGETVSLSEVQLPRLGLAFHAKPEDSRLHCTTISGLFVSDRNDDPAVQALAKNIQHRILLENQSGELFLLCACIELMRVSVADCPMNTESMPVFGDFGYFTYPVHVAGLYLQCTTRDATLYLLYLRLVSRDYAAATELIGQAFVDAPIAPREDAILSWVCNLFNDEREKKRSDVHPDATACLLRILQLAWSNTWGKIEDIESAYTHYAGVQLSVSASCRLSIEEELELPPSVVKDEKRLQLQKLLEPADGKGSSGDQQAVKRQSSGMAFPCKDCNKKMTWGNNWAAYTCRQCEEEKEGTRWLCVDCQKSVCPACKPGPAKLSIRTGRSLGWLRQQAPENLRVAQELFSERKPSAPTQLTVVEAKPTSVVLRWTLPDEEKTKMPENAAPLIGYRLLILPPAQQTPEPEPEPEPEELSPGLRLEPDDDSNVKRLHETGFWDRMYNHHIGGGEMQTEFQALGGTAQAFQSDGSRLKPDPSDTGQRWTPDEDPNKLSLWYVIRTVRMPPDANEMTVVGLLPDCEYSFRLQALNRIGASDPSEQTQPARTRTIIERFSSQVRFDFTNAAQGSRSVAAEQLSGSPPVTARLLRGSSIVPCTGTMAVDLRSPGMTLQVDEIIGTLDPLVQSKTGFKIEAKVFIDPLRDKDRPAEDAVETLQFDGPFEDVCLMGQVPYRVFEEADLGTFLAHVFSGKSSRKLTCNDGHALAGWNPTSAKTGLGSKCSSCGAPNGSLTPMLACQACGWALCAACQGYHHEVREAG